MPIDDRFGPWMIALERRHMADLRLQEVTRALRALSSVYVERRDALHRGAALDSAGKRAAFALFYGPLHFMVSTCVVDALDASQECPATIVDLGCGTGAVGAAWALCAARLSAGSRAASGTKADGARVLGFDKHPWAVSEASWTYRALGVDGVARREDARDVRLKGQAPAIALAFTVNELPPDVKDAWLPRLLAVADAGGRVLVIEPIARPAGSWWDRWSQAFGAAGGREDLWRFEVELPPLVRTLDHAAGLDHRVLTARTLYLPGRIRGGA